MTLEVKTDVKKKGKEKKEGFPPSVYEYKTYGLYIQFRPSSMSKYRLYGNLTNNLEHGIKCSQ